MTTEPVLIDETEVDVAGGAGGPASCGATGPVRGMTEEETMLQDYTIRDRTVRVELDVTATRPPGRGRTWTVEGGHWRAEGVTEKDALGALAAGLREFLARYGPPRVLAFRGYVAVVSP